jgi:2-polyprenyl-6-methoxyphenol hydroxylase-like FAD-dependent oxidoreductase
MPEQTDCCVVGGGPAGAVLALTLARKGIRVTLLEAKGDFDREFRGDTLHPAVMEALDALGLAEAVLALPHARVERFVVRAGPDEAVFAEFSGLQTRFPYIVMVPQASLLELLMKEASRYPNFRLLMNARVEALLEDDGPETMQRHTVLGVRYRGPNGIGVIRADLTVGADGRFSVLRRLAKLETKLTSGAGSAMDVLWFRLPSEPGDPPGTGATFRFGRGGLLVLMRHAEGWQAGLILEKNGFAKLKAVGLQRLRATVAALAPEFALGRLRLPAALVASGIVADRRCGPSSLAGWRCWHQPCCSRCARGGQKADGSTPTGNARGIRFDRGGTGASRSDTFCTGVSGFGATLGGGACARTEC